MIPFRLKSPRGEARLEEESSYSLAGPDGERWPIVDGIPYLRTAPDSIADDLLDLLDSGNGDEALALALEQGDGRSLDPERIREVIANRKAITLRDAVAGLGYESQAADLLYVWSDPDFLATLALLEAHWNQPRCVFEFSCGIGAHLRELAVRGFAIAGSDSSFAKLWLARNWVLRGDAQLLCFDPSGEWPIADSPVDLVMCNGAFHKLGPRAEVLACLRKTAGEEGWLIVTHLQGGDEAEASPEAADATNPRATVDAGGGPASASQAAGSESLGADPGLALAEDAASEPRTSPAGGATESDGTSPAEAPFSVNEVEELFPDGLFFADSELIQALVEARAPVPQSPAQLWGHGPFSVVFGPGMRPAPRAITGGVALPPAGANLVRNPLYGEVADGVASLVWPSEALRRRIASRAIFPPRTEAPAQAVSGPETDRMARRRELVALPRRW